MATDTEPLLRHLIPVIPNPFGNKAERAAAAKLRGLALAVERRHHKTDDDFCTHPNCEVCT